MRSDPQAPARVASKLQEVERAKASGRPATLRLDEAEVNGFLSSALDLKPDAVLSGGEGAPQARTSPADPSLAEAQAAVRDVKIQLLDDRVRAYVIFDFHGKDLSLMLEGKLGAQGGYLRFVPTAGALGSFPIPQSALETAVSRLFDSPENREQLRLPETVRDVRIENGEVVVTYR